MPDAQSKKKTVAKLPPKGKYSKCLPRSERAKKIRQIAREYEAKRRELGLKAPLLKRGPVYYFVIIGFLAALLGVALQISGKGGGRGPLKDAKLASAERSVDAIAEALGRFKFHTGVYPSIADGGIEALVYKHSKHRGWIGPYLEPPTNPSRKLSVDPWKHDYIYLPPAEGATNELPKVSSMGPDGLPDTADDIRPDPALFEKPFHDTTWTNDWVPYPLRGYIIVPPGSKKKINKE